MSRITVYVFVLQNEKKLSLKKSLQVVQFLSALFLIDQTKIVLSKVLQNFKLYLLAQKTELKRFSFFPRNIQYRARLKGPPFTFFRHCATFFDKKFSKLSPSIFLEFCDKMVVEKFQRVSLSVFFRQ